MSVIGSGGQTEPAAGSRSSAPAMPQADLDEISRGIRTLYDPADVVELRVPKTAREGVISGYFNDHNTLAHAVKTLDGRGSGLYLTLNPVNPALLARSANRVKSWAEVTTTDTDILFRRWLPIDCDPKRPAQISSAETEHALALEMARQIRDDLADLGFPDPILADSGNGAHLLYRLLDFENDENSTGLVQAFLQVLAEKYNTRLVTVDQTVFNPARIWKAYGSIARKGDSVPERPHRMAKLLSIPTRIQSISREILKKFVPDASARTSFHMPGGDSSRGGFDVGAWLLRYHVEIHKGPEPYSGGEKWILKRCPFNPAHEKPAVIRRREGQLLYSCLHNSCANNRWEQFHALIERGQGEQAGPAGRSPGGPRPNLIVTKGGTPKALLANAITILRNAPEWQDLLAFDEFSLQIVVKKPVLWLKRDDKNWTDGDDIRLTEWLQRKGVHVTPPVTSQAVFTLATENRFHPVREYLSALKWDGVKRLDTWTTTYLGMEDAPYSRAVGARWTGSFQP